MAGGGEAVATSMYFTFLVNLVELLLRGGTHIAYLIKHNLFLACSRPYYTYYSGCDEPDAALSSLFSSDGFPLDIVSRSLRSQTILVSILFWPTLAYYTY